MSVKKQTSTHFTLYNLKALFPPTHTQFTNGFHICSTGSFSLTLAFVIDYVVVREIAFSSGEGLDVIEMLWATHRNERFWPSSLARSQRFLSVQGQSGGDSISYDTCPLSTLAGSSLQKLKNAAYLTRKPGSQVMPSVAAKSPSTIPWPHAGAFLANNYLLLVYSLPSARLVFTQKFTVYTVFCLCFRRLVSASPRNGGIISTEAWRPRQALAGRAWGQRCRTFSARAWRRRLR